MLEDKLLVIRCKRGSRSALGRIYEKYKDGLLILAIALLNDTSAAEDILHDVFIRFVQGIENFELTGSLKAYLSTCVVNAIRNRMKSRQHQAVNLEDHESALSDANDPSGAVICNEELQQLTSALAQIPHEQREIIVLHVYSNMSFKAIAKSQDISANTVKSRYRYGINKLKSVLQEEER